MTPVMVTLVSKFPKEGYKFIYIVVQKSTNSKVKMYFSRDKVIKNYATS